MQVVIIGAGVSGLIAASEILTSKTVESVTIVEALPYIGGRIKACRDFIPGGHKIDLGAEYIHGHETILTDIIKENAAQWEEEIGPDEDLLEEIFIAAHADGGPAEHPTKEGKYGVYYLAKEDRLLRFDTDDADFLHLTKSLSNLEWETEEDGAEGQGDMKSLGTYLEESVTVAPRMMGILEAGFGNTAACTDLYNISLSATKDFESHWEENEVEGDTRLHSKIGMVGVVDFLTKILQNDERCSILLNWNVSQVEWNEDRGVRIVSAGKGEELHADKVIITAPPPIMTSGQIQFHPPLPNWKIEAYNKVGMERAIKIIVRFSERFWPKEVQTVIAADELIPEIWFREMKWKDKGGGEDAAFLAVGFLTSKAADELVSRLEGQITEEEKQEFAADIIKDQLAKIFRKNRNFVDEAYVSTIMFDWGDIETIKGGYIYPKVGITKKNFYEMASPIGNVLYFAGEATNTGACCTVQAAMETGERAAKEVLATSIEYHKI
jgi:monoamine oxidase|eukprot:scaffold5718_cov265-Chaetoceros_neogracile.AAC.1